MHPPSPALIELARWILHRESAAGPAPAGTAGAADRAVERLRGELETLAGPSGTAALVRRAHTLARREFPFLDPDGGAPPPGEEAQAAASVAVLAYLLGLLTHLMGEELGLLPVRTTWPDSAPHGVAPSTRETEG